MNTHTYHLSGPFLEVYYTSEEISYKIVNSILSKIRCTPQELSVLLTTGDAYVLHYLIEK